MAKKVKTSDTGHQKSKGVKYLETLVKYNKPSEGVGTGKKRKSSQVASIRTRSLAKGSPWSSVTATPDHRSAYGLLGQTSTPPIPRRKITDFKKIVKVVHPRFAAPQIAAVPYITDIEAVTAILGRLVKPRAVQPWLNKRLQALGRRKPIDVIRSGGVKKVIDLLTQVEEGIHI